MEMTQAAYNNSFIGKNPRHKPAENAPDPLSTTRKKTQHKGIQTLVGRHSTRYLVNISIKSKKIYLGSHDSESQAMQTLHNYAVKHNIEHYKVLNKSPTKLPPKTSKLQPITINGITKTAAEWCKIKGTNVSTWRNRITRGINKIAALQNAPHSRRPNQRQKFSL